MSDHEAVLAGAPAIQAPPGTDASWAQKIDLAIHARLVAEERWKGKSPVSPQSWPFSLHQG
jgi:hypothetical protein